MAEAVVLAREALQISQRVLGPEHRRTLLAEHNLVDALDKSGNTCEAAQLHSENVEAQLRAIHEVSRGLASATLTLTLRLVDTGDCDAGESLLQNSLKLGELTLQDNDWRLGAIKSVLGECLTTLGRYEEAGPLVVESYPVIRAEYGDGHAETRNALQRIIRLYEAWGKPDKAAEYRALLPETPDTDLEER